MRRALPLLVTLLPSFGGCLINGGLYQERLDELSRSFGVIVKVVDPGGVGIAGADVRVVGAGGSIVGEATTDAAGFVRIDLDTPDAGAVSASHPDHAPSSVAVVPEAIVGATVVLAPLTPATLRDGSGAITVDEAYSLAVPAGALDGVAGDVALPMAWGQPGAVSTADDDAGNPLDLIAAVYVGPVGSTTLVEPARLLVPDPAGDLDGRGASVFWLDPVRGGWVEQGPADSDRGHLGGDVTGLDGWWALATPLDVLRAGCLDIAASTPAGDPLPWAEVRVLADGAIGPWRAQTALEGTVCVPASIDSAADLSVMRLTDEGQLAHAGGRIAAPAMGGACGSDTCEPVSATVNLLDDADQDGIFAGAGGDCDDNASSVFPGAPDDTLDGQDNNCDGIDGTDHDRDGDASEASGGGDCDDRDRRVSSLLVEVCDGLDNDCAGGIDDALEDQPGISTSVLGACAPCARQALIDQRPLLHWSFAGDGAIEIDHSGWGRDGTRIGFNDDSARFPGIPHWPTEALFFGGSLEEGVLLDVAETGWWPTDTFTVALWVRPAFNGRGIVSYFVDPSQVSEAYTGAGCAPLPESERSEFGVYNLPNGVRITIGDGAATVPGALPSREWTHLVATYAPTEGLELYRNGQLDSVVDVTCEDDLGQPVPFNPTMRGGGVLHVGQDIDRFPNNDPWTDAQHDGTQAFEGLLGELMLFDQRLSATAVAGLYGTTTCDEGPLCNGIDDDGDGIVDEHLQGSATCPAASCVELAASGSELQLGPYVFDLGAGPLDGYCESTFSDPPQYCGDGFVLDIPGLERLEACDDGEPTTWSDFGGGGCSACAMTYGASAWRTCEEAAIAGAVHQGPYVLDLDGAGLELPTETLCDLGAGDWTLYHRLSMQTTSVFYDVSTTEDSFCKQPPTFTTESSWCTAPENCECFCGAGAADFTDCLGPRNLKFSALGALADAHTRVVDGCVEYELRWPFHGEQLTWAQDWDPLGPRGGLMLRPGGHPDFDGLAAPTWSDPDGVSDGGNGASGDYTVGMIRPPDPLEYGHNAFSGITPFGDTTKIVELWARSGVGLCTTPP